MSQSTVPSSDADPFEIDDTYASLFDDLNDGQFQALKASIRNHGVDTPIIIDAENKVIDGHHRVRAVRELRKEGHDIPDIPFVQKPTRVDTLRARRANLARRDGHKKAGVQDYLREHLPEPPEAADTDAEVMWPDDDDAWTFNGVAHELGVGYGTVRRAVEKSIHIVHLDNLNIPSEREQKRDAVRSYIEANPDATDTEVADAVEWDISQPTVNRWRNEWFGDDNDDTDTEQSSILGVGNDANETQEIAQDAADGEKTATETLEEEGTATGDTAAETRKEKQKEQNRKQKEKKQKQQRDQFQKAVDKNDAADILQGDFTNVVDQIDDPIDHIITDPPYGEDAIKSWRELGRVAAEVLEPSGMVVAYSGKHHLPSVIDALDNHLEYFWQGIVVHKDAGARIWPRNIRTDYKPILVFQKPPVEKLDTLTSDVIDGAGAEKDAHDWQQATAEAVELVEKFTEPNDHIVDPMCGSGTTGVAALETDRRVTLIDRDPDAIKEAERRCSDVF